MPNALSEYRAPLKPLLSSSTLDTPDDASPEGDLNRLPTFSNGLVCAEAPSVVPEDTVMVEGLAPPRYGDGGRTRLLTGGAEVILDVGINREEGGSLPPPAIEVAARCRRRRSAMGKARAAVVMAS
jgi:hypothetical protein